MGYRHRLSRREVVVGAVGLSVGCSAVESDSGYGERYGQQAYGSP